MAAANIFQASFFSRHTGRHWILLLFLGAGGILLPGLSAGEVEPRDVFIGSLDPAEFSGVRFEEMVLQETTDSGVRRYRTAWRVDGLKVFGLLSLPPGDVPQGGFPAVVLCHGYIPAEKYSTLRSYTLVETPYAEAGFAVLKPDYRGVGESPSDSPRVMDRAAYPRDVLAGIAALRARKEIRGDHLFLYGHSLGGDVALRVLAAAGGAEYQLFRGAVLWAPVYQPFPESLLYYVRRGGGSREAETKKELRSVFSREDYPRLSPENYLEAVRGPVLIRQGREDRSVPYAWGEQLAEDLKSLGKEVDFRSYPGADHNLRPFFSQVIQRDIRFFRNAEAR